MISKVIKIGHFMRQTTYMYIDTTISRNKVDSNLIDKRLSRYPLLPA